MAVCAVKTHCGMLSKHGCGVVVCWPLQKLEELKHAQEEELEDRLDAGVKRILAANRRLAEELRLHVTVSTRPGPSSTCRVTPCKEFTSSCFGVTW